MTIDLTEDQVSYIKEYLEEKLQENLDLDEYDMLIDLSNKLDASDDFTKEDIDDAFEVPRNVNQVEMFESEPVTTREGK